MNPTYRSPDVKRTTTCNLEFFWMQLKVRVFLDQTVWLLLWLVCVFRNTFLWDVEQMLRDLVSDGVGDSLVRWGCCLGVSIYYFLRTPWEGVREIYSNIYSKVYWCVKDWKYFIQNRQVGNLGPKTKITNPHRVQISGKTITRQIISLFKIYGVGTWLVVFFSKIVVARAKETD